jgi:hypothetical protein
VLSAPPRLKQMYLRPLRKVILHIIEHGTVQQRDQVFARLLPASVALSLDTYGAKVMSVGCFYMAFRVRVRNCPRRSSGVSRPPLCSEKMLKHVRPAGEVYAGFVSRIVASTEGLFNTSLFFKPVCV